MAAMDCVKKQRNSLKNINHCNDEIKCHKTRKICKAIKRKTKDSLKNKHKVVKHERILEPQSDNSIPLDDDIIFMESDSADSNDNGEIDVNKFTCWLCGGNFSNDISVLCNSGIGFGRLSSVLLKILLTLFRSGGYQILLHIDLFHN